MPEYRVQWQQQPHIHHPIRLVFVEAASESDAREVARDHIERTYGINWFSVYPPKPTTPRPAGKVISG